MRTSNRINSAECFGRGWRACARGERQIVGGLVARGMLVGAAAAMLCMFSPSSTRKGRAIMLGDALRYGYVRDRPGYDKGHSASAA